MRILLIDDNYSDRLLIKRHIVRRFPDWQIESVGKANELASALRASAFDLVVSDYSLGWSDGLAILKTVKARWPDCRFILFTGDTTENLAAQAINAGADRYVAKSEGFPELVAAISQTLEKHQLQRTSDRRVEHPPPVSDPQILRPPPPAP